MAVYGKILSTVISFGIAGILVNGISLLLLAKFKNSNTDKTQRWIITNLCLFSLFLSITYTVTNSIEIVQSANDNDNEDSNESVASKSKKQNNSIVFHRTDDVVLYIKDEGQSLNLIYVIEDALIASFVIGNYLATLWLVLDRYLHIIMIIRYTCYWSHKKTLLTTLVMWTLAITIGSLMRTYLRGNLAYICNIIYIALDSIIIFVSFYVYSYALIVIKKQKQIHLKENNHGITKGVFLSVCILLTFIVTVTIPDIISILNDNLGLNENFAWYSLLCNSVSVLTDAIIYILLSPKGRWYFKKKLHNISSRRNSSFVLSNMTTESFNTSSVVYKIG